MAVISCSYQWPRAAETTAPYRTSARPAGVCKSAAVNYPQALEVERFLDLIMSGAWPEAGRMLSDDSTLAAVKGLPAHWEPQGSCLTVTGRTAKGGSTTALHRAVINDAPVDFLLQLIKCHPEAVRDDDNSLGVIPLHLLCECGLSHHDPRGQEDTRALDRMLSIYPEAPAHRDHIYGQTPLLVAVQPRGCSRTLVRKLLAACPKAAGIASFSGMVPLHNAVGLQIDTHGQLDLARDLLTAAPHTLKAKTHGGWTPLQYACCNGQMEYLPGGACNWDSTAANVESLLWILCMDMRAALQPCAANPQSPLCGKRPGSLDLSQRKTLASWRASTCHLSRDAWLRGPLNVLLGRERRNLSHTDVEPFARVQAFLAAVQAASTGLWGCPEPQGTAELQKVLYELLHGSTEINPALLAADRRISRACEAVSAYVRDRQQGEREMLALLLCLQRVEDESHEQRCKRPKLSSDDGITSCKPSPLMQLGSFERETRESLLSTIKARLVPKLGALVQVLLREVFFGLPGACVALDGSVQVTEWDVERFRPYMEGTWAASADSEADGLLWDDCDDDSLSSTSLASTEFGDSIMSIDDLLDEEEVQSDAN